MVLQLVMKCEASAMTAAKHVQHSDVTITLTGYLPYNEANPTHDKYTVVDQTSCSVAI